MRVVEAARPRRADLSPRRAAELGLLEGLRIRGWERLLFIECGDGLVAEEAWRRMAKGYVCGVDRSSQRVALATRLRGVLGRLEFKVWDGRSVPCPDGFFDGVVSQRDLRRSPEPLAALRELRRVVAPGGEVHLPPVGAVEWSRLLGQAGFVLQRDGGLTALLRPR